MKSQTGYFIRTKVKKRLDNVQASRIKHDNYEGFDNDDIARIVIHCLHDLEEDGFIKITGKRLINNLV